MNGSDFISECHFKYHPMYSKGDLKRGEGVRMDEDSQSVKIGKSECGWWKREKSVRPE